MASSAPQLNFKDFNPHGYFQTHLLSKLNEFAEKGKASCLEIGNLVGEISKLISRQPELYRDKGPTFADRICCCFADLRNELVHLKGKVKNLNKEQWEAFGLTITRHTSIMSCTSDLEVLNRTAAIGSSILFSTAASTYLPLSTSSSAYLHPSIMDPTAPLGTVKETTKIGSSILLSTPTHETHTSTMSRYLFIKRTKELLRKLQAQAVTPLSSSSKLKVFNEALAKFERAFRKEEQTSRTTGSLTNVHELQAQLEEIFNLLLGFDSPEKRLNAFIKCISIFTSDNISDFECNRIYFPLYIKFIENVIKSDPSISTGKCLATLISRELFNLNVLFSFIKPLTIEKMKLLITIFINEFNNVDELVLFIVRSEGTLCSKLTHEEVVIALNFVRDSIFSNPAIDSDRFFMLINDFDLVFDELKFPGMDDDWLSKIAIKFAELGKFDKAKEYYKYLCESKGSQTLKAATYEKINALYMLGIKK